MAPLPPSPPFIDLSSLQLGYLALLTPSLALLPSSLFVVAISLASLLFSFQALPSQIQNLDGHVLIVPCLCSGLIALGIIASYLASKRKPVYLFDFACFHAPGTWRVPFAAFVEHSVLSGRFDENSLEFQKNIIARSGLGESTAMPPALHCLPPAVNLLMERYETEFVVFPAIDELLRKTRIQLHDIGILVVNCSVFCPVPSMPSMIVNRYKLRSDIRSYNLAGMGCSAGIVSLDLANRILQHHAATYALVISTENMTRNWYFGNNRSMLVTNCIFRAGAAAILLSNKSVDRRRSKYQLKHTLRTQTGADDKAYKCIFQEEDELGERGVNLSKDLMGCAADALKNNLWRLGPLVLPTSELLIYVLNLILRNILRQQLKPYVPDIKMAFNHFCIHSGGRAVIQQLEKSLQLTPKQTEPARMTLHRFGNISSSTIWYALAYLEAKGKVKRNDKICLIGLGSGFKCCSGVLHALRTVYQEDAPDAWKDCIMEYPVEVSDVRPF